MGLGDDIMAALATVLPILRNVERVVVFDNRMADPGTHVIIKAVQGMPYLTYLGKTRYKAIHGDTKSAPSTDDTTWLPVAAAHSGKGGAVRWSP